LENQGVILIDKQYIVGEKPRGYRFHPDYLSKLTEKTLEQEKQDIRMFTKNQDWQDVRRRSRAKFLLKWIFTDKLKYDYLRAIEFLDNEYQQTYQEDSKKAFERFNRGIMSITRLRNGDL